MKPAKKENITPLGQELRDAIRQKGPISLSEYMHLCLSHPQHGYYMNSKEKIGQGGDFITAPEISQMFGELLGIWCVAVWQSMGCPKNIQLVELGPGKGTLMKDLLRSISSFPAFVKAIDAVNLVETSKTFQKMQQEMLHAKAVHMDPNDGREMYVLPNGLNICWLDLFWEVPDAPILLIGQEMLDALPIHQFEYTDAGWREVMVDVSDSPTEPLHFKFVLSKEETRACKSFLQAKTLKQQKQDCENFKLKIGDQIEVCPLAITLAEDVAARIGKFGGAALFIDYGENHAPTSSVRAFKAHKEVHLLSAPGFCDITADVDFAAIARAVIKKPGVDVFGAVTQATLLRQLGIETRLLQLIEQPEVTDEQANMLYSSYERLVDDEQMGRKYKAFAITQKNIPEPPGFGALIC